MEIKERVARAVLEPRFPMAFKLWEGPRVLIISGPKRSVSRLLGDAPSPSGVAFEDTA